MNHFRAAAELAGASSGERIERYYHLLFRDVELRGAAVLDIGGGSGEASFYAIAVGARSATCLEPLASGSNPAMTDRRARFANAVDVQPTFIESTLQAFVTDEKFDVVVLNNSINHLDESACSKLLRRHDAWEAYVDLARGMRQVARPGAKLVAADCSRRNLFGDLRMRNPVAPTINWSLHHQAATWSKVLAAAGWTTSSIRYDSVSRLGRVGQAALGNRVGSYLTNSHFILTATVTA